VDILLVSDAYLPTVSGVASSTDSIARFMAKKGHHVDLVCPRPLSPFDPHQESNVSVLYTPGIGDSLFVNKSYTPFPLGFPLLWKCFRTKRYDVIHIQEPGSLGITALLLALLYRVPTVGARHFSWLQIERVVPPIIRPVSVPFIKAYVSVIYRLFHAIMVPTKTAGRELADLLGRSNRIYAVSNGVETQEFIPSTQSQHSLRKKYTIPLDRPVFFYLGRLDADKNVETIFRAAKDMKTPYHLLVVGVGRQKASLVALSKSLQLESNITWIEETNRKNIIELYQLSDVFVIMSPVETQSIVALQAISCGLPLVAANAGALPELVNKKNGFLVDTYDSTRLTEVMDTLGSNPTLRASMGNASRAVSLRHEKSLVLQQLLDLFIRVARKMS